MDGKKRSRRDFLKLGLAGIAALYTGCSSFSSFRLGRKCDPPPEGRNYVRVMSYNVANMRGSYILNKNNDDFFRVVGERELKRNLEQMIRLVETKDVDVICMNEADFDSIRTQNIDQAKYIADRLCYPYIIEDCFFGLSTSRLQGDILQLGNAVVSRYPLRLNKVQKYGEGLGNIKHRWKTYVDFDILLPGGTGLKFIQTHFDHRTEESKRLETDMLLRHIREVEPDVVLGDFNSRPTDEWFRKLMREGGLNGDHIGPFTYPASKPYKAIDHILISKDRRIANYHVVKNIQISDHLPVIGDIILS